MKQYIITGEQLERLTAYRKRVLPFMCPDERDDWVKFMSDCESHLYNPQADREKVLDGLCKSCQYGEEMPYESCFDCVVGVKRIEFREGKDGE